MHMIAADQCCRETTAVKTIMNTRLGHDRDRWPVPGKKARHVGGDDDLTVAC
jgi:hypothetical protein